MARKLFPSSPRYPFAQRLGREIRKALRTKGLRLRELERAGIGTHGSLGQIALGYALPRLDIAERLAEILDAPAVLEIVLAGRRGYCEVCGREFIDEGAGPRKLCSELCKRIGTKRRAGDSRVRAAMAERDLSAVRGELARHREAVAQFCKGCEPDGICRTASCSLRSLSPLPLSRRAAA